MASKNLREFKLIFYYQFLKISSSFLSSYRHISKSYSKKSNPAEFRNSPNVFRQPRTYTAVVQDVFNASSSIKILQLLVREPGFSFKAGQWVDFSVPSIPEITGYSMTSPPRLAKEKGILELSIKNGKFPTTSWVHTNCAGGEEVIIQVGGDFHYDPQPDTPEAESDLLLVGGGVGINPMVSILWQYNDLLHDNKCKSKPGMVHLLYSAKTEKDLIFKDTFSLLKDLNPKLKCQYFVTNQLEKTTSASSMKYSRIQKQDLIDSISKLQSGNTVCYICGPSTMTDDVNSWLRELGIDDELIRYEKWW